MSLEFFLEGKPKAKQRPRWSGKFMYSPKSEWEKSIADQLSLINYQFNEAVRVDMTFYMPRPKNHYRTGKFSHILKASSPKKWHTSKPDRDNLDKAVLDCMTKSGIFSDDSIVCDGTIKKMWANFNSGVHVKVTMCKTIQEFMENER